MAECSAWHFQGGCFDSADALGLLEVGKKLNVLGQKLTNHSFRHTFATKLAESVGHSPFAIKAALGHSTLNMTDRYVHPTTLVIELDFGKLSDKPGDYPGDFVETAKIESM